jgi:hypothetical protein
MGGLCCKLFNYNHSFIVINTISLLPKISLSTLILSLFFLQTNSNHPLNLLAIPVGVKQKLVVDKIVKKVTVACLLHLYNNSLIHFHLKLISPHGNGIGSSHQVILLSCFFIMMVLWMDGRILLGVIVPYMCLL